MGQRKGRVPQIGKRVIISPSFVEREWTCQTPKLASPFFRWQQGPIDDLNRGRGGQTRQKSGWGPQDGDTPPPFVSSPWDWVLVVSPDIGIYSRAQRKSSRRLRARSLKMMSQDADHHRRPHLYANSMTPPPSGSVSDPLWLAIPAFVSNPSPLRHFCPCEPKQDPREGSVASRAWLLIISHVTRVGHESWGRVVSILALQLSA